MDSIAAYFPRTKSKGVVFIKSKIIKMKKNKKKIELKKYCGHYQI